MRPALLALTLAAFPFFAFAASGPELSPFQVAPQPGAIVSSAPRDPAFAATDSIRRRILAQKDLRERIQVLLRVEGEPLPEITIANEDSAPCAAKYSDMDQAWSGVCVFDVFSNRHKIWGTLSVTLDTDQRLAIQPLFIDVD